MIQTTPVTPETIEAVQRRTEGHGWLERHGDVRVLKVAGSFYDMGYQHGRLLAADIADGPLPYFGEHVKRILAGMRLGPATNLVYTAIQKTLGRSVAKGMPDYARETLRGLAEGAGISEQELLDGCTMPDSLLWVAARAMQLRGHGPAVAHRLALGLGCTSAIAWGDATADGQLLHARNFDYHGVSVWPRNKTVIFHEPDDGQRYLSVAAAGVAMGGVTAMNEAGLTLTVHQHMFTDATRLGGTPIGVVGDRVMRDAESIDDAQKILDENTPVGCWTYLIAERSGAVLCYEENPNRSAPIRPEEGQTTFGYSNIFLDAELGATEVDLWGTYWRHNQARYRRATELLEERHGTLDPQSMAEILADTGDPACRLSESIAMVMTTGSVVFRPADGVVWVGTGEAPTSHGRFLPLSLGDEGPSARHAAFEAGPPADDPARVAFEHYRRAYVAYVENGDLSGARAELAEAVRLQPAQPGYRYVAGLLELAAGAHAAAAEQLEHAVTIGHAHPERMSAFLLWRGRVHDLARQRPDAERCYRRALAFRPDPQVRNAALRNLRRPYRASQTAKIHVELSLGDVITP